eukprot:8094726-Pyramimonas_sp.AAC.2
MAVVEWSNKVLMSVWSPTGHLTWVVTWSTSSSVRITPTLPRRSAPSTISNSPIRPPGGGACWSGIAALM